jgi:hypothetical protein
LSGLSIDPEAWVQGFSGVEIGDKPAFDLSNAVFETQLAFLQPLQLQLVRVRRQAEMGDDVVQIPVLQA